MAWVSPDGTSLVTVTVSLIAALSTTQSVALDPAMSRPECRSDGLATKKQVVGVDGTSESTAEFLPGAILATLVQTHTLERAVLSAAEPSPERFSNLLADRTTGSFIDLDPHLLTLLRAVIKQYPGARIELVSGYRSPKLNEMMRKKGHNVASHSQHSLGKALDFRIVAEGATKGVDPLVLEKLIRKLGWNGGVGVYPKKHDWFVHADAGRNRHWKG